MALAPLAVAVPMIAAALLAASGGRIRRPIADGVALAAVAATCVFCALLLARSSDGTIVTWFGGWHPHDGVAIGVDFAVDGLGAGLATFVAALAIAALLFSWRYLDAEEAHLHVLILVFTAGMVGFCLSGDLFNMFVFFELMSVAAFALAGYKVDESEAIEGSLNFAVTNVIGSLLLLTGIGLLYGRTGALNLAQAGAALAHAPADGLVIVAFSLIAVGFLVKAAIVPFHFWLPDAYAVALTPACILFAGAMSELGVYGLARVYFTVFSGPLGAHADALRGILIGAGVLTALLGAVLCLVRLLAFATVSYMGVFLIGAGTLGEDGIAGTAIYVIGDGCAKAALFACVGIVQHRLGAVSLSRLFGAGRPLRVTAIVFVAGGLLLASLPPSAGFLGKSMLDDALITGGYGWAIAVIVAASILTGAAVLLAGARIFGGLGERPRADRYTEEEGAEPEVAGAPDRTPAVMIVPAIALALAALAFGLVPGIDDAATAAAHAFVDRAGYEDAVLAGHAVAVPSIHAPPLRAIDWPLGIVSSLGAVAVAALAVSAKRTRRGWRRSVAVRVRAAIEAVRDLHSGRIGDYVTWLVAGTAVLGGLVALAVS
jgi:multicomponent Na+:H+ antiporter subunit D